jgi:hypothetical protein
MTDITQSELDDYLFNDHKSLDPVMNMNNELIITLADSSSLIFTVDEKCKFKRGSYGIIKTYKCGDLIYALKYAYGTNVLTNKVEDGNERLAIIELRSRAIAEGKICPLVQARIVQSATSFITLMPKMRGDVSKIPRKNWTIADKKYLLDSIREQMEYILHMNTYEQLHNPKQDSMKFAYVDLKPENVLYNRNSDGTVTYKLGDLGSILEIDPDDEPGCFPGTYAIRTRKGYMDPCPDKYIVKCMRYLLGLFAFNLLTTNTYKGMELLNVDNNEDEEEHSLQEMNNLVVEQLGQGYDNLIDDSSKVLRVSMYG